jgi:hypothetical protein
MHATVEEYIVVVFKGVEPPIPWFSACKRRGVRPNLNSSLVPIKYRGLKAFKSVLTPDMSMVLLRKNSKKIQTYRSQYRDVVEMESSL